MKKRVFVFFICLLAMMAASLSAYAQEITITLNPGWNWISYPNGEVMDIDTAFGDFVPTEGDVVQSQNSNASFRGGQWIGQLHQFTPGLGYKYYSMQSEVVSFVFATPLVPEGALAVTTNELTDITETTATCGGSAVSNDGTTVLMKGVCWATHPYPTTNDSYTENGSGSGVFTTEITELAPNTVYYVRAYAASVKGVDYGEEVSFATEGVPTGAINGKFTINEDGDQVYFSQGNLQYIGSASTPYWKFADNQWDYFGTTTGQNSNDQNVDRDLFGWGTSGWNPGNNYYHPWDTYNAFGSSYGPSGAHNLTGDYANADWGVYNAISNGGDEPEQWRTLTKDEWGYVFDTRSTSTSIRYAKASLNDVNGVILLPDDWSISYYDLNDTNTKEASYSCNTIADSEWDVLEQHGAVFLPATGYRFGTSVKKAGVNGYYWSTSYVNSTYAYGIYVYDTDLNPQDCSNRTYGRGVRLVCNAGGQKK